MRSWPIRWKLLALPMAAVLLVATATFSWFEATRHYERAVRASVAAAINPLAAESTRDTAAKARNTGCPSSPCPPTS